MTDTERLDLIEHYKWEISYWHDHVVIVNNEAEFVRSGKTLRAAIDAALKAQFEWSVGK